jgi:hypothetical protein
MLMFLRLKSRAVPIALLMISSLWMAALLIPLLYSFIFPHPYLREAMRAFEGRPVSHPELAKLGRDIAESFGTLQHAIRLAAYYHGSVEYKSGETHKTTDVEYTYLVRFEKRQHYALMTIGVTEIDDSAPKLNTWLGTMSGLIRVYLSPVLLLAFSVYWFRRSRRRAESQPYRVVPLADSSPDAATSTVLGDKNSS